MWIFSRYGFFSIVNKLDKGQPVDRPLQIRTRWDSHLKRLRAAFPELPEPSRVTRSSDYSPHRIYASPEQWATVMAGMAKTIDYGNFKGFMDGVGEFAKDGFAESLHAIWGVVYNAFNRKRRNFQPGILDMDAK
jgi:hypothetical protein